MSDEPFTIEAQMDEQGRPICLHDECMAPAIALVRIVGCIPQSQGAHTAGLYCIDHVEIGSEFCIKTFLLMAGLKLPETSEEQSVHEQTAGFREQLLRDQADEGREAA